MHEALQSIEVHNLLKSLLNKLLGRCFSQDCCIYRFAIFVSYSNVLDLNIQDTARPLLLVVTSQYHLLYQNRIHTHLNMLCMVLLMQVGRVIMTVSNQRLDIFSFQMDLLYLGNRNVGQQLPYQLLKQSTWQLHVPHKRLFIS